MPALTLGNQGAQAQLCAEPGSADHTFDTSSEPYDFISEALVSTRTVLDPNTVRGTRSHNKEILATGPSEVGGPIRFNPSPGWLDAWLPRILGATEATDVFALAETLPAFGILIDRVGQTFEYENCYVNRATFRGRQGELIEVELDIWGEVETPGTTFPVLTLPVTAVWQPYTFCQGALTIFSGARTFMDFELIIDNMLERRFGNSCTATSITPKDRVITLKTTTNFTSTEASALYATAVPGAAGSLVFTNSGLSATFTFGNLTVTTQRSPVVEGKQEITLPIEMTAYKSGTTDELVVTNDSTA